ncbi:MAG: DNA recombination protein RmuC, partial [Flavobacterium sp.]|nr:DNA recombination protein RmuC [Flavobacterium sp.]
MSDIILFTIVFILALAIGIYIGKLLFTAQSKSEKSGLEERINGLLLQIDQLKIRFQEEQNQFSKNLELERKDKEEIRREKDSLSMQLTKKEADFENLWQRNKEQKQEVEELQEKFTKEFENLANKILEEKTVKFTEQNKENLKNILSPLQEKIQ